MKALKSSLAKKLLADPVARKEFRSFLMNRVPAASDGKQQPQIEISMDGKTVHVTPKVVLRAA